MKSAQELSQCWASKGLCRELSLRGRGGMALQLRGQGTGLRSAENTRKLSTKVLAQSFQESAKHKAEMMVAMEPWDE